MTAVKTTCLDDATLDDFVHARLSGARLVATEAHLDSCQDCSAIASVLAGGELAVATTMRTRDAKLERGATVGRHVVTESLGEGAMGVVYLAYDPQLERKVALKLVRATTAPEAQRRMLREAQAMAQVADPNVVAIYDVGRLGEGNVYLAMEFVDGITLHAWLLTEKRALEEVRSVLLQAGRGLAAAHDVGLVHRDFKPANVLVGRDGRVRVTDFGLARVLLDVDDDRLSSAEGDVATVSGTDASLTRTGALLGTPSYMAPEVLARGEATAASDQFSFGVTLYEAVHGERPFLGSSSSLEELRDAIKRGPSFVSSRDGGSPVKLRRVMERALAFGPSDRYPSMRALLADLEPKPTPRVPAWVFGATLAGVAVIAGLGLATSRRSAGVDPAEACSAGAARVAAVIDAQRAGRIRGAFTATGLRFAPAAADQALTQLEAYAREWASAHRTVCEATVVRREQSPALLDARMHCLQRRLDELEALATTFEAATPDIVVSAADAAAGLPRIDACANLTSLQSIAPRPSGELGVKLSALETRLATSRTVASVGGTSALALEDAKTIARDAETIGYRPAIAETHLLLATLRRRSGDFEAAGREGNAALLAAEASHDDRTAALAWLELLAARGEQGNALGVIEWAGPATAAVARLGNSPALEGSVLFEIGVGRTNHGDFDDAQRDLEASLERRRSALPAKHIDIARTLSALGNVARAKRELDRALALHTQAMEMDMAILGEHHPALARHEHNIAGVLRLEGKLQDALARYLTALDLERQGLGPRHLAVGRTENSIGLVWLGLLDTTKARVHFTKALDILSAHPDRGRVLHNLGIADAMDGKHADALAKYDAALRVLRASFPEGHESIVAVLASRAKSERARGVVTSAVSATRQLVPVAPSRSHPPPPGSARPPQGSYAPAESWDTHH